MKWLFFLILSNTAAAELNTAEVDDYFKWLEQTEKQFSSCEIELKNNFYVLCDNTKVPKDILAKLATQKPNDIEKFLTDKNIRLIKICETQEKNCTIPNSKTQKQMTNLHGLYNPAENSITYKDGSSTGVLIHEYIHHLQSRNENPINGKVYKKTRLQIQEKINEELNTLEQKIQKAQKNKDQKEILSIAQKFITINTYMINFGKWQDLIDERSIFLLYKHHGKDLQIPQPDIDFANKKLKALCENPQLKSSLSNECN